MTAPASLPSSGIALAGGTSNLEYRCRLLGDLALAVAREVSPEAIVAAALGIITKILGADFATLWIHDAERGVMRLRNSSDPGSLDVMGWELPVERLGVSSEKLLIHDTFVTARYWEWFESDPVVCASFERAAGARASLSPTGFDGLRREFSLVGIPVWNQGELLGLLAAACMRVPDDFDSDKDFYLRLGEVLGASLQKAFYYEELEWAREGEKSPLNPHDLDLLYLTERQRRVLAASMQVWEGENRRLAEDIHDTSNQIVTGIQLKLSSLKRRLGLDPASVAYRQLSSIEGLVGALGREQRNMMDFLNPATLRREGLMAAVERYGRGLTEGTDVAFACRVHGPLIDLAPDVNVSVYRIVCEAVSNAVKHARAHAIEVVYTWDESTLTIEVADDGVGFEMRSTCSADSWHGLVNMANRAIVAGGRLQVDSSPGCGTNVVFELELP